MNTSTRKRVILSTPAEFAALNLDPGVTWELLGTATEQDVQLIKIVFGLGAEKALTLSNIWSRHPFRIIQRVDISKLTGIPGLCISDIPQLLQRVDDQQLEQLIQGMKEIEERIKQSSNVAVQSSQSVDCIRTYSAD